MNNNLQFFTVVHV